MSTTKKSKAHRKIEKRIFKSHETLFAHEGIRPSDSPTNMLFVANGGWSNGVTKEEIYESFVKFGSLSDILMHPHKSYCFVVFQDEAASIQACSHNCGQVSLLAEDKLVYLSYVPQVPENWMREGKGGEGGGGEERGGEGGEGGGGELPNGLLLMPEYLKEEDIAALLLCLQDEAAPSHCMKNRSVRHCGFQFDYSNNGVELDNENVQAIPPVCVCVMERLVRDKLLPFLPDQLTINTYSPGHGIPAHIDNPEAFENHITVISLGSQINMDFKHANGNSISVHVPGNSVMVMAGESRYQWTHGIVGRGGDVVVGEGGEMKMVKRGTRTSLTFRKVKPQWLDSMRALNEDKGADSTLFKSAHSRMHSSSTPALPSKFSSLLEREHVQKVYDAIGGHFSDTRHSPWPRVAAFVNSLAVGSLVLDVGCGNGKYLKLRRNQVAMLGCDNSTSLCDICWQQGLQALVCDISTLPYRSNHFDAVLCIAVIHHLASKERRMAALQEIHRVLVAGGRALVYVWAMEQKYQEKKSNYLKESTQECENVSQAASACNCYKQVSADLSMPVHVNRTAFKQQDTLVPWHLSSKFKEASQDQVLHRYYHLFKRSELAELCQEVEGLRVEEEYYDQGNWAYELMKS